IPFVYLLEEDGKWPKYPESPEEVYGIAPGHGDGQSHEESLGARTGHSEEEDQ
ncbi:hypothetical protein chiPu_0024697, partial [Chiloscyllium punctatum]|nr:hypothetical protein [Chiloscyllium punctatum]